MKRIFFLFCIGFASLQITSQVKLRDAYIITLKNDTIKGIIQDQSEKAFSLHVLFSKDSFPEKYTTYNASEIQEFGFEKKYIYRSFLIDSTIQKSSKVHRFLKFVVGGNLGLYKIINDEENFKGTNLNQDVYKFFLKSQNEDLIYLPHREYFDIVNNEYRKDDRYRGILFYKMKDYEKLKNRINQSKYIEDDLSKLVLDYNIYKASSDHSSTKEEITDYRSKISKFRFGMNINTSYTNFSHIAYSNSLLTIFDQSVEGLNKGISAFCLMERGTHNRYKIGITLENFKTNKEFTNKQFYRLHYNMTFLSMQVAYSYYMNYEKFVPFIEGGAFINRLISDNSDVTVKYSVIDTKINYMFDKTTMHYFINIGVSKKMKRINPYISIYYKDMHYIKMFNILTNIGSQVGIYF